MANDDLTEQILDFLIYAPIGFVLDAKELIPKLAERGRGQVALTRLAGRVAAQRGSAEAATAGVDTPAVSFDSPIDEYASLTATQIIPLLADLSQAELSQVGAIERAGRNRSTILNRLRRLSD